MRYLIGSSRDTRDKGLYPFSFCRSINRADLLRCLKYDDMVVIDLDNRTVFDPKRNEWVPIREHSEYAEMFK